MTRYGVEQFRHDEAFAPTWELIIRLSRIADTDKVLPEDDAVIADIHQKLKRYKQEVIMWRLVNHTNNIVYMQYRIETATHAGEIPVVTQEHLDGLIQDKARLLALTGDDVLFYK